LIERHLSRDITQELSGVRGGLLVDVGCGGRPYESCVASAVRYIGLDLTPTVGSRPDCWARADAIPLADGVVDVVLCTQVIEHLPDPSACLSEMARILAPGGRLVVTAPQAWNLHEAPSDYFRFTRYGLETLCVRAGLEIVSLKPQGGFGALIGLSTLMYVGFLALGGTDQAAHEGRPTWIARLLRWPLALHNIAFAAIDGWSGRGLGGGVFAVNHILVAKKAGRDEPESARTAGACS
jgi:SAM-dependent methyltransferase